jgi:hypothetical protein
MMIKRIVIVIIAILVPLVGRGLYFYTGIYSASPSETPSYENIATPIAPSVGYSDVYKEGEGTILVDLAHDNAFDREELNVLISRLATRGLTISFLGEDDDESDLEEELSEADAFIIVGPQAEFSREEGEAVGSFVDNGGRLLLIADPTRSSEINSIAIELGLIFESGYLYNQKENDANYRNIFITEFQGNEITKDLTKIALYTAGSITSADGSIAFGDENTFSSVIETRTRLSPLAQASESKVLAIYDLTFITEPYNGILDNNQLISNIADWLAGPVGEEEAEAEEEESEEEAEAGEVEKEVDG